MEDWRGAACALRFEKAKGMSQGLWALCRIKYFSNILTRDLKENKALIQFIDNTSTDTLFCESRN